LPAVSTGRVYDAANRLTAIGATTLTYDANGNLTGDGANSYVWNARDQLTEIRQGATIATFSYDAFGRRIQKTVNGTTTGFLYDGADIVQELSGTTPTATIVGGLGIDDALTRTDGTGTRAFLTDGLGSTLSLVDGSGTKQTSYTYDAFGGTTASGQTNANSQQYTGREHDGTGLYYYRARYYSPALGRFISEDPIGFAGGLNQYAYVGNSPTNFIDPHGLESRGPENAEGSSTWNWFPGLEGSSWNGLPGLEPSSPVININCRQGCGTGISGSGTIGGNSPSAPSALRITPTGPTCPTMPKNR
jgi:RHS repeat-associated protein